jgi:hypothetical protein
MTCVSKARGLNKKTKRLRKGFTYAKGRRGCIVAAGSTAARPKRRRKSK